MTWMFCDVMDEANRRGRRRLSSYTERDEEREKKAEAKREEEGGGREISCTAFLFLVFFFPGRKLSRCRGNEKCAMLSNGKMFDGRYPKNYDNYTK